MSHRITPYSTTAIAVALMIAISGPAIGQCSEPFTLVDDSPGAITDLSPPIAEMPTVTTDETSTHVTKTPDYSAKTLEAAGAAPTYSADVPDFVLTPDEIETRWTTLKFFDGMPDDHTVQKAYDFLDLSRGAEAFLKGIPATSIHAMLEGFKEAGMEPSNLGIFEELMDAQTLFLTPNSTTMYAMSELNLKDGPVVLELPSGVLGPVNDAFFRFVTDIGQAGPDQGKGGKYLFAHRDHKGELPDDGYFVVRSPTYRNLMFFRAFVKDDDLTGTANAIKEKFRMYPLAEADNPPEQTFVDLSGKKFNTIHANDFQFYNELNEVVQYEPADVFNPELVGLFASIGIKKGKPFEPDDRMERILNEAVAIGNATARAITFRPRSRDAYFYPDRQWFSPYAGGSHEFMNEGEMVLDDRVMFHYYATGISPSMVLPKVGTGSVYEVTPHDSERRYLDGGNTYKITMPAPIPANDFWSFMVYSGQHRSMLETDQKLAGLDSNNPAMQPNDDGSYTVWFGPEAPLGHEGNWIQTVPNKSFNVIMRLYGPTQPWFDKTWKPGDLELVE